MARTCRLTFGHPSLARPISAARIKSTVMRAGVCLLVCRFIPFVMMRYRLRRRSSLLADRPWLTMTV